MLVDVTAGAGGHLIIDVKPIRMFADAIVHPFALVEVPLFIASYRSPSSSIYHPLVNSQPP